MCLKPSSCSRVSKWSESLRCWHASRLLSLLSCRLSSLCWAVNHLLYLWTHSLTCHHVLSSESSVAMAPWAAPRAAHARKVCKLCVNPYISIVNLLQKDMQAQPQTKTPLHTITSLTIRCSTIIEQCDKDYIQYSGTDVCSGRRSAVPCVVVIWLTIQNMTQATEHVWEIWNTKTSSEGKV